jgi:hypothetical protein
MNKFNWIQYILNYPDIQRAGISTEKSARMHYRLYGMNEGRTDNKINVSIPKTYFISFYTQGPPFDNANDLSNEGSRILFFSKHFDSMNIYNTEKCTLDNPLFLENYMKYFSEYDNVDNHSRGCRHSFWKWKPYIIKKELEKIEYNEILIYQDSNVSKYPFLLDNIENYKSTVFYLFNKFNNDIIIPSEKSEFECKKYVKNDIFNIIGKNNDYYRNFPIFNSRRIFIRKTDISLKFIDEWLHYCNYENLILPEQDKETELLWSTHDQAILTVLYRKYIEQGIFLNSNFSLNFNILSVDNIE